MTDHLFKIPPSVDELGIARKRFEDAQQAYITAPLPDPDLAGEVQAAKANLERIERERIRK